MEEKEKEKEKENSNVIENRLTSKRKNKEKNVYENRDMNYAHGGLGSLLTSTLDGLCQRQVLSRGIVSGLKQKSPHLKKEETKKALRLWMEKSQARDPAIWLRRLVDHKLESTWMLINTVVDDSGSKLNGMKKVNKIDKYDEFGKKEAIESENVCKTVKTLTPTSRHRIKESIDK